MLCRCRLGFSCTFMKFLNELIAISKVSIFSWEKLSAIWAKNWKAGFNSKNVFQPKHQEYAGKRSALNFRPHHNIWKLHQSDSSALKPLWWRYNPNLSYTISIPLIKNTNNITYNWNWKGLFVLSRLVPVCYYQQGGCHIAVEIDERRSVFDQNNV